MEELLKKLLDEVTVIRVMLTDMNREANKPVSEETLDDSVILTNCGLSFRLTKALYNNGIKTVGDLRNAETAEISKIRNLGAKSIGELNEFMAKNRI